MSAIDRDTVLARFWARVNKSGPVHPGLGTECWLWTGEIHTKGYGRMYGGRNRRLLAHRVAYELFTGPIPLGLQLDHLCRVRLCVNPAHLEPVTCAENIRRSPISLASIQRARTHCPQGHPYAGDNLVTRKRGRGTGRHCRECRRQQQRA